MTKELVAQDMGTELSAEVANAWTTENVSAKDIVIPKIMVMQGLSQQVIDGEAKFGDFVDSLSGEVKGSINSAFEFIPIYLDKLIYVSGRKAGSNDDHKFMRVDKLDAKTEALPWNDTEGDMEIKRSHVYNFYVLDPKDMSLPYIISFKGMSLRNGKSFNTIAFVKSMMSGSFPAASHYSLVGEKRQNDKGTFVVISAKKEGTSAVEEVREAVKWKQTLDAGAAKVHEPETAHAEPTPDF